MSLYARRARLQTQPVHRPTSIALVGLLGVLTGLAMFGGAVALAFFRTRLGQGWGAQLLDLALAAMAVLLLVWMYWGVWEMVASAWWLHLFGGPVLIVGMLALVGYADTLAPFVAHHLSKDTIALTGQAIRAVALGLAALEVVTLVLLLGMRKLFGIGVKKPLWERVNR
jgi:hypothetical protein